MLWDRVATLLAVESVDAVQDHVLIYKIPSVDCIPADFRVEWLEDSDIPINFMGSKALGEPPFVLGLVVWAAAKQALSSLTPERRVNLGLPPTSEEILRHLCECDGDGSSVKLKSETLLARSSVEANISATAKY